MEIVGAKLVTGQDVVARKVTQTKMTLGVPNGEETFYDDILIFQVGRHPSGSGMAMSLLPFSFMYSEAITVNQEQWDRMVLIPLPVTKQLENLYLQQTSGIQLTP